MIILVLQCILTIIKKIIKIFKNKDQLKYNARGKWFKAVDSTIYKQSTFNLIKNKKYYNIYR